MQVETAPGHRLRLHRAESQRPDAAARRGAARDRLCDRSRGHRQVPAPRFATTAVGIVPPMSWAFERNVFDFRTIRRRRNGCSMRPAFPIRTARSAAPLLLTLKTSTSEVYRFRRRRCSRISPASASRWRCVRRSSRRCSATGARQLPDVHAQFVGVTDPDMLRRVFHSAQLPSAGLQSRALPQPRRRSADRGRGRGGDATRIGAGSTARCSRRSRATCRTFRLWYKTNVAVFQPDIHGVRCRPSPTSRS